MRIQQFLKSYVSGSARRSNSAAAREEPAASGRAPETPAVQGAPSASTSVCEIETYSDRQIRAARDLLKVLDYEPTAPDRNLTRPFEILEKLSNIALEHAASGELCDGVLSRSHHEYSLTARCAMQIVIHGMPDPGFNAEYAELPESERTPEA